MYREKRNAGEKLQHKGQVCNVLPRIHSKTGGIRLRLEARRTAVLDHLNGGHWKLIAEITEVESGKKSGRGLL